MSDDTPSQFAHIAPLTPTGYRPYHDNPQWPYPKGTRAEDITPALINNARTAFLMDNRIRRYETVAYFVEMERQGRAPPGRAAQCWADVQSATNNNPWSEVPWRPRAWQHVAISTKEASASAED